MLYLYFSLISKRHVMKNLFYIALLSIAFVSCRDTKAENAALEQQRELDSIKLVMKEQKEALEKQKTIDSMFKKPNPKKKGKQSLQDGDESEDNGSGCSHWNLCV